MKRPPSPSPSSFAAVLVGLFVCAAILSVGNRPAEEYQQRLLSVSTRSNGLLPFGYARKYLLKWREIPPADSSDGDTAIFWTIPRVRTPKLGPHHSSMNPSLRLLKLLASFFTERWNNSEGVLPVRLTLDRPHGGCRESVQPSQSDHSGAV